MRNFPHNLPNYLKALYKKSHSLKQYPNKKMVHTIFLGYFFFKNLLNYFPLTYFLFNVFSNYTSKHIIWAWSFSALILYNWGKNCQYFHCKISYSSSIKYQSLSEYKISSCILFFYHTFWSLWSLCKQTFFVYPKFSPHQS